MSEIRVAKGLEMPLKKKYPTNRVPEPVEGCWFSRFNLVKPARFEALRFLTKAVFKKTAFSQNAYSANSSRCSDF
jgi:hypothetical protein